MIEVFIPLAGTVLVGRIDGALGEVNFKSWCPADAGLFLAVYI
jgi:hypothetical protein